MYKILYTEQKTLMLENTIIRVKGTSIIIRYNENIYYVVLMSLGSRHSNCPNSVCEARRETTAARNWQTKITPNSNIILPVEIFYNRLASTPK